MAGDVLITGCKFRIFTHVRKIKNEHSIMMMMTFIPNFKALSYLNFPLFLSLIYVTKTCILLRLTYFVCKCLSSILRIKCSRCAVRQPYVINRAPYTLLNSCFYGFIKILFIEISTYIMELSSIYGFYNFLFICNACSTYIRSRNLGASWKMTWPKVNISKKHNKS